MSFQTALSGLNAATTDLDVISNNIANVSTTGFKQSRAEFADLIPASPYSLSNTLSGSGVKVSSVAQQFSQGNIEATGNVLDLAISGQGFFILNENGSQVYSRAGNFSIDRDGYVVNPARQRLQAFAPNSNGGFNTGSLGDLQLQVGENPPVATQNITISSNLPAAAPQPAASPFDPSVPTSYNHTTSLTVYDSLGVPHVASLYFAKTAIPNEWASYTTLDGNTVGGAQTLAYSNSGTLISPASGQLTLPAWTPPSGAAPVTVTLNLASWTQYGSSFSVNTLRQDGNTTGSLVGIAISDEGAVFANFSNGQSEALGQVALANFPNTQGLQKLGDNAWSESYDSGQPLIGQAGTSAFGLVQASALESSNVNQTEQLVEMITAQRNFQANAQMITTHDQITQTVLNIR